MWEINLEQDIKKATKAVVCFVKRTLNQVLGRKSEETQGVQLKEVLQIQTGIMPAVNKSTLCWSSTSEEPANVDYKDKVIAGLHLPSGLLEALLMEQYQLYDTLLTQQLSQEGWEKAGKY